MKLTKLEHACLILDNGKAKLIIDPGCFTKLPDELLGVSCLIITEEHVDHFDVDNVQAILKQSPTAKIFTTANVFAQLKEAGVNSTSVEGTQTFREGDFEFSLYETPHAPVYEHSPCRSLSVKVNDYLYYPSDSFNPTSDQVEILALPTSGPWHKISEAIDFANLMKSKRIIATHNGLYNDDGNAVANNFIKMNLADKSRDYIYLEPGENL